MDIKSFMTSVPDLSTDDLPRKGFEGGNVVGHFRPGNSRTANAGLYLSGANLIKLFFFRNSKMFVIS
jgi:hypothetical protein